MRSACLLKHNMQCTLAFVSLKTLNSTANIHDHSMTHSQQQLGQVHDANPFMTRDAVAVSHIFYHWFCHKQADPSPK